jgi:hypothetical protein
VLKALAFLPLSDLHPSWHPWRSKWLDLTNRAANAFVKQNTGKVVEHIIFGGPKQLDQRGAVVKEIISMDDYFKKLAEGSLYHSAKSTKGLLQISAKGGEADPDRKKFNEMAKDAEIKCRVAGYRFDPHTSSRDPHGWDTFKIYFD